MLLKFSAPLGIHLVVHKVLEEKGIKFSRIDYIQSCVIYKRYNSDYLKGTASDARKLRICGSRPPWPAYEIRIPLI